MSSTSSKPLSEKKKDATSSKPLSEKKKDVLSDLQLGLNLTPQDLYLITYNTFQTLGWLILLIQVMNRVLMDGFDTKGVWDETSAVLKIFQTLAVLEIIHAATGIVRSNVIVTTFQIFSRVFILWAICSQHKTAQLSIGYIFLLIAWSVTEVIRYSFYFLAVLKHVPYFHTYLRYTLFIILYPLGVTGELMCVYAALPIIAKQRPFSIAMPNKFNFAFDFYYATIVIALLYIPIFPKLYLHMFAQRKKTVCAKEKSA